MIPQPTAASPPKPRDRHQGIGSDNPWSPTRQRARGRPGACGGVLDSRGPLVTVRGPSTKDPTFESLY